MIEWRAFCNCGKRLVSDISYEHLLLLAGEHAAYHTRTKRQATPVMKIILELDSREICGQARGSGKGPLAAAA